MRRGRYRPSAAARVKRATTPKRRDGIRGTYEAMSTRDLQIARAAFALDAKEADAVGDAGLMKVSFCRRRIQVIDALLAEREKAPRRP